MKAFLKRRWILLSCGVLLLACSVVSWRLMATGNAVLRARNAYLVGASPVWSVGIEDGTFYCSRIINTNLRCEEVPRVHRPQFGSLPLIISGATSAYLHIPLWILLSAVLGWIVFRELRWRDKQRKLAEDAA